MSEVISKIRLKQEIVEADIPKFKILVAKDVLKAVNEIKDADRERNLIFHLDSRNNINSYEEVSVGTLNASILHSREVFKSAIINQAAGIIFVHNHPSGEPEPSHDDILTCKRLTKAGEILDIQVLDCLIIGKEDEYSSIKESYEL